MQLPAKRFAVLGAGLQGACIALELAARGAKVDLYERNSICLAEASTCNTGKLHLGFVYARDTSLATARLLAEGVLSFEPLLGRWLGEAAVSDLPTSSPDYYVVHRDGLIGPDDFDRHGRQVAALLVAAGEKPGRAYFGRDFRRAPEHISHDELAGHYRTETAVAAFRTEEISIDPEKLAVLVRRRLAEESSIRCLTGRSVVAVQEAGPSLTVVSAANGCSESEGYDFVVNALWTGRLTIDQQLGLSPRAGWCFRFRYFLRAVAPTATLIPSTTVVLGPYGEVATFPDGSLTLSWYPAGLRAWSTDLEPPELPPLLAGPEAAKIKEATLDGLATVIRGVAGIELKNIEVRGGWIFAFGETDIDDPGSELHRRSAVGVQRHGRYLTVNTGKLTLAPAFAERAVKLLRE